MNRAAECRDWLRANPGWHYTGDVLTAIGKVSWPERQPYAGAMKRMAEQGILERQGHGAHAVRYRFLAEPKRLPSPRPVPARIVVNRAAKCRTWLRDHPGWHFTADILDAMGLRGRDMRHPYAKALIAAAKCGSVSRRGEARTTRYSYLREPTREVRGSVNHSD